MLSFFAHNSHLKNKELESKNFVHKNKLCRKKEGSIFIFSNTVHCFSFLSGLTVETKPGP